MDDGAVRSRKHEEIRSNTIKFYTYWFGYFLNIGPYFAVMGLQSSINIEASIGMISLGVAYVVSFVTGLFFSPFFIRRFGCKYAILAGEVGHLVFVAANFYPVSYVMIASSVVLGVGEGLIWTAVPMFSQFFGYQHGIYGRNHRVVYIRKYTGIFFGAYYAGQIFGHIMTYALLHGGITQPIRPNHENLGFHLNTNFSLSPTNSTDVYGNASALNFSTIDIDSFEYCGANDCQDPEITKSRISNYVPADKMYLNILLCVFCALSLTGILLHMRFLPTAKTETFRRGEEEEEEEETITDENRNIKAQEHTVRSTLVATFRHAVSLKQLMLVPILLHSGLLYGFYLGELSRAFASCILGVEKVGLVLMMYSVCSAISSISSGKVIGFFGRNKIIPVLLVTDISNYIFCLLWRPQEIDSLPIYGILALFGITDAGWKNCILSAYADYFPKNQEIAFTLWNSCFTVGIATSFCWSPLLCVRAKIYIQSILLTTATATYGVAEFVHRSRLRDTKKEEFRGRR